MVGKKNVPLNTIDLTVRQVYILKNNKATKSYNTDVNKIQLTFDGS